MEINYKGNIISKLYTAMEKNPTMSFGEILHSFTHKNNFGGQHFFYQTDEDIYTSLEKFTKIKEEEDEPLSSNEFEFWVEGKRFSTTH